MQRITVTESRESVEVLCKVIRFSQVVHGIVKGHLPKTEGRKIHTELIGPVWKRNGRAGTGSRHDLRDIKNLIGGETVKRV